MFIESRSRSILKTLSWRLTATLTTMTLVFLFTGQIATALSVAGVEVFAKIIIYYLHERGWDRIRFGRREINPAVIWITGLSGSGKGELAQKITQKILDKGFKAELINGNAIRHMIPDLGFTKEERDQHIRRVGYFANKMEHAGVFVVASFVSPDRDSRNAVRESCNNFIEVYASTPLEECKKSEAHKELYEKAERGEIENVAGVDFAYEASRNPEYQVDLSQEPVETAANKIMDLVVKRI